MPQSNNITESNLQTAPGIYFPNPKDFNHPSWWEKALLFFVAANVVCAYNQNNSRLESIKIKKMFGKIYVMNIDSHPIPTSVPTAAKGYAYLKPATMDDIKVIFTVTIPREIENKKKYSDSKSIRVRSKIINDAAQHLASFCQTKMDHDIRNAMNFDIHEIKEIKTDEGITVSWDIENN